MKKLIWCVALALSGAAAAADPQGAFDWPQWQGPDRNAVSREQGLLKEWPAQGPPLAWTVKGLGGGYNAPSIAAGRIYGMSNRNGDEVVWALAESDGKTLWTTKLGPESREGMSQGIEGPGCSPTIDGDHMYVLGAGGALACLQVADGKVVWTRNLIGDFGGVLPVWRYSESPLVDGEKVVCTPGSADATLVALNKLNGELIWKSVASEPKKNGDAPETPPGRGRFRNRGPSSGAGYSSAIAIDFEGQRQYVQLTAKSLLGVAADTGKVLWRYDRPANAMGINCSTPVYRDGHVFAASAYGTGGGLVKLSKDSDGGVEAKEVYFTQRMQNHHGGMIYFDGCLYGAAGGNGGGFLVCLDFATGEVLWSERKAPKGALAFADQRLYLRTEDGEMLLIEPSRSEFLGRGRFAQPDRSEKPAWAHPVVANGKLYIRDQDVLLCYDVKAK